MLESILFLLPQLQLRKPTYSSSWVAQGHTADKWQKQDLNLGLLVPEPTLNSKAWLSCLSVLLTLHSTHSSFPTPYNQHEPLKPVRPDLLPWNKQSPLLSLWFHTTLRMPFLPLPAYLNSYLFFRNKSNATSSKQSALTTWGFILFSPLLYQWHNLGLHFASSFPQYVHSFEQQKKIFVCKPKIPLKIWILV